MIFDNQPLFLENPEWYTYDVYEGKYKLTDKATKEARKSYEKFYKRWKSQKRQPRSNWAYPVRTGTCVPLWSGHGLGPGPFSVSYLV